MSDRENLYFWLALCLPFIVIALLAACEAPTQPLPPASGPVQWLGDARCKGKPLDVHLCEEPGYRQHDVKRRKAWKAERVRK